MKVGGGRRFRVWPGGFAFANEVKMRGDTKKFKSIRETLCWNLTNSLYTKWPPPLKR